VTIKTGTPPEKFQAKELHNPMSLKFIGTEGTSSWQTVAQDLEQGQTRNIDVFITTNIGELKQLAVKVGVPVGKTHTWNPLESLSVSVDSLHQMYDFPQHSECKEPFCDTDVSGTVRARVAAMASPAPAPFPSLPLLSQATGSTLRGHSWPRHRRKGILL
jgi:hypothetical protein